jgi:hypothetical protein
MVQFWAYKEVVFVHCCVLQFPYCALVMVVGFVLMEVCCKRVVTFVEPEICDCVFSGFVFVVFPCSFNVLPLCLAGWGNGFLGEFLLCFLLYKSLDCYKVKWLMFVCFEVFLPVGLLFQCRVFLRVRGPTERQLLWPVCLRLQFLWHIYSKRVQILLFLMKHHIKSLGASLV